MWAVRLPRDQATVLGRLRTRGGIDAAVEDDTVWLRVVERDERLESELRGLARAACFEVDGEDRLVPLGQRVPVARMPQLSWRPLAEFISVSLPVAALSGRLSDRAPFRLVRTERAEEPTVLVTSLAELNEYIGTAPEVRLQGGRFAACRDGRAVVHVDPLLPLPGERYVERNGVALPAGWGASPALPAEILATALGLSPGDLALLSIDGTVDFIAADQFVRLSRSSVRSTGERLACPAID